MSAYHPQSAELLSHVGAAIVNGVPLDVPGRRSGGKGKHSQRGESGYLDHRPGRGEQPGPG